MRRRVRLAIQESFALKVLFAFAAVIIVTLTVYTALGVAREGDKIRQGLAEKGALFAGLLSHNAVIGIFAENSELLRDAAAGVLNQKDVLSVSMYNADLKLLYAGEGPASVKKSTAVREGRISRPKKSDSVEVGETPHTFEFIAPVTRMSLPGNDTSPYLDGAEREKEDRAIGYVRIVLSKDSYRREISALVARNAVVMLVFILSSGVIVWFAVNKVMRPLKTLTERVKALEKGMPVEPIAVETRDEVGKLAVAFNTMVVARGEAEASLRESEDRYRRLVELSPDAIYVQQEGRVAFINAAGAALLGASGPSGIVGRSILSFVIHQDRAAVEQRLLRVEEEGASERLFPVRYWQREGIVIEAEAAAAPFLFRGRPAVLVIARDVTERKGMEERIRTYQKELYSVASEMTSLESRVEERERHLIAADLHDYVGQNLVVSNFKLGALRKSLAAPDALRHLEEIRELLGQTIEYTRSLTVELNPPILVEIGFKAAVQALAAGFQKTHGIAITVEDNGHQDVVDDDTRYLIFRCVRELLMNVVKHSRATQAMIILMRTRDSTRISVADNGMGFEVASAAGKKSGFGLFSIRERIKRLGGFCEIDARPGIGTTVTLTLPLGQ